MNRDRFGIVDAIFSLKSFVAAMLAYYIAVRIGLQRPYWAVLTTYIVSQPLAGAVLSKAVYRVFGTLFGAAVTVALVPNLDNAPELLTLALATWLSLCIYVALLGRTPKSYAFLLAGYTTSLIGFPSVQVPDTIFTVAILRVQEITLGIVCASFMHGVILPQTVTARLLQRVDTILRDAARWSAESFADRPGQTLESDRRRLAFDIFEIHQMSTHLPFDTARLLPRLRVVRALQDQISMMLALAAACADRINDLRRQDALPSPVSELLEDAGVWLGEGCQPNDRARDLIERAQSFDRKLARRRWSEALLSNLLVRFAELVDAHAASTALRDRLNSLRQPRMWNSVDAILQRAGSRPLHRDHGYAIRAALAVWAALLILSAIWIGTAWPDGGTMVMIIGAMGAIFSSTDMRAVSAWKFFCGSIAGVLIAATYSFAILPHITDFVPLVLALAPTYLLIGGLTAQPVTAPFALAMIVTVPTGIGFTDHYAANFAGFVNANIAQEIGFMIPILAIQMASGLGADGRARRLLVVARRELATRCVSRSRPRTERWLATMLDRIAYLYPRVAVGEAPEDALRAILIDTRIGINVDTLRDICREAEPTPQRAAVEALLEDAHAYLRASTSSAAHAAVELRGAIDRLLFCGDGAVDQRLSLALVGLRRNLFPDAPAPERRP